MRSVQIRICTRLATARMQLRAFTPATAKRHVYGNAHDRDVVLQEDGIVNTDESMPEVSSVAGS